MAKFKVGDVIQHKDGNLVRIDKVTEHSYYLYFMNRRYFPNLIPVYKDIVYTCYKKAPRGAQILYGGKP